MSGLLARGVPSISSSGSVSTSSSSTGVSSPSGTTSLSMASLSISEESLSVPPSLFVREIKIEESEVVGRGSYGTVSRAKWYGTVVAVKKLHDIFQKSLNTSELRSGLLRNLARELNILVQVSHPNIVQFYGIYKPPEMHTSLELTLDTYIVQEFMCCSLDVRNLQRPRLTFRNVTDISLDISSGLQYLHDRPNPIIHRDLATKNVLLSHDGVAKIGDLGVAKVLNQNLSSMFTRQPGTELYMPPEVKIQGVAYDTKIDIYSFGVIMLEVSIGRGVTAREAFEVDQCGSGMIKLVPELERREADFKELGKDHLLRVLIVDCLGTRDSRPSAKTIHNCLLDLSRTKEYIGSDAVPIIAPTAGPLRAKSPPLLSRQSSENKELFEKISALEENIKSLSADKEILQKKLDYYLKEDRTQGTDVRRELKRKESEVHQLMTENAMLQVALSEKESEMERLSKLSTPPSSLTDPEVRDQRAMLLQRLNRLEMRDLESQGKIAALRSENEALRSELEAARCTFPEQPGKQFTSSTTTTYGAPSSQFSSSTGSCSHSSLETIVKPPLSSLQSSSSSLSGSSYPTTSSSTLMTSSLAGQGQSTVPHGSVPTPSEFKKLKKQLERYKSANIELDLRLKDAKLDLQKYQGQQSNTDIMYQMDVERLTAENAMLRSQLDSAVNENGRLRSDLVNRKY